jgi:hypothetical protein
VWRLGKKEMEFGRVVRGVAEIVTVSVWYGLAREIPR